MKVALCQINTTLGDFSYNRDLILSNYSRSLEMNAELIVFPEMAISGYPAQDLLFNSNFILYNQNSLEKIIQYIGSFPVVIGTILRENGILYNGLVVIQNKKIIHRYHKQRLPNYDIFDEKRYFKEGESCSKENNFHVTNILGYNIGFQICEDMWYPSKVTEIQMDKGKADLIINISASPYTNTKLLDRLKNVKLFEEFTIPFYYCNLVGAQDEIIFDGRSFALSKFNSSLLFASSFKEDILIADVESNFGIKNLNEVIQKINLSYTNDKNHNKSKNKELKNKHDAIILGIRDFFKKTKNKKAIIGLSGGIDSSITAYFASKALGNENVLGVLMPSKYSSDHSITDSIELAKILNIKTLESPINNIVDVYQESIPNLFNDEDSKLSSLADENIQARIRANILMYFSNKYGYLLLSTSNKTELALGYSTLYGDMSGALSPIGDLSKSEVYELTLWINDNKYFNNENKIIIPENSISKPPSAELKEDQIDPFDYEKISAPIEDIIRHNGARDIIIRNDSDINLDFNYSNYNIPQEDIIDLQKPIFHSEFKRNQSNIILKLSNKSFGTGRKFPIAANYDEFIELINNPKTLK